MGFKISSTKMEYMNCILGGDLQRDLTHVRIEARDTEFGSQVVFWLSMNDKPCYISPLL